MSDSTVALMERHAPRRNGRPTGAPDLARLADCFPARDIEWRVQSCGTNREGKVWAKVLAYVNNRAIMARLDEVCGPENWRNEFREWNAGKAGVLCGISIRVSGEWVTKWDGAENTDIEEVKGGLSSAMKRAAVQWGIGRYLYDLDEGWAVIVEKGEHYAKTKEGKAFYWNPPPLPAWALPKGSAAPPHDSIEANSLSPGERADARQQNPRPAETPRCTKDQLETIAALAGELPLRGNYWPDVLAFYKVKRLTWLTPDQADELTLNLKRDLVRKLLTEFMVNLDDVRVEAPAVTADTPDELDQPQADAALTVLRKCKENASR
jgi:hypothetical protein